MTEKLFNDVVDEWLFYKKTSVKVSTYTRYLILTKTIQKAFTGVRIYDLSDEMIGNFFKNLQQKLAASTVQMIITVLKSIFFFAEKREYIVNKTINFPKITRQKNLIKALSVKNCMKLNRILCKSGKQSDLGILLALNTGLRIGEICALKCSDVDLGRKCIHVGGTVCRTYSSSGLLKTKLIIIPPKSVSSIRDVPIPEFLVSMLKKCMKGKSSYLLTGKEDKIMEVRNLQRKFKDVCNREFGYSVNFHALRHTYATLSISNGVDEKTVSEILGHASVATTLSFYRGVNFDDKMHGIHQLEKIIGPKTSR